MSAIAVGQRFGHVVVTDVMTATEMGIYHEGVWCRIRCDCGRRRLRRARHLRQTERKGQPACCGATRDRWCPALPARLNRAKLTPEQVLEMRRLHASGKAYADIGRMFAVSYTAAWKAVRGVTWRLPLKPSLRVS